MRPSAFSGGIARALDLGELRDVDTPPPRPCRGRRVAGGLFGQPAVAVPDRDRGAGIQQPLDDRPADALRAAGDDGAAPAEIDLVGHFGEINGACLDLRASNRHGSPCHA